MITLPQLPHKKTLSSIAVLTSGGDAPGMNAAIRSVVRYAITHQVQVFGISRGYSGLLEEQFEKMSLSSVANIIQRGGTLLKTARCPEFLKKSNRLKAAHILKNQGIEGLVIIGGEGSFLGAHALENDTGIRTIGVPGTIDHDVFGTEDTIGFDTAVNTAVEAIDRIRDTANSHDRTFLIEVMGRNSGFIALYTGISAGAETIVVPEVKTSIPKMCELIQRGINRGKTSSIIIVAEGPQPGHADRISAHLKKRGYDSRVCTLGHIQRGGTPTARDRMLGSMMGASAVAYLINGKSNGMIGTQNNQITFVPFSKVISHGQFKKTKLPQHLFNLSDTLAS